MKAITGGCEGGRGTKSGWKVEKEKKDVMGEKGGILTDGKENIRTGKTWAV